MKVVENHGNISKSMIQAGYDPTTAQNPSNLTNSKGWNQLLEEYLPDHTLVQVHKEGLKATRIHTSHTEPDKVIPDYAVRHKYLETGYKVKNKIVEEPTTSIKMILRLDV